MDPERWRKVESLYHAALDRDPAARAAYLSDGCLNDPDLRREVEELLAYQDRAAGFIETPAINMVARQEALREAGDSSQDSPPPSSIDALSPGIRLGNFEIVELIGRGGMGEVWRARDARLNRDVAIKVLPAGLARDPDRVARFEREARAAAALSHPNICVIHEVGEHEGQPFIAMEFLVGQTLKQHIAAQPLKADELLEWAVQIADGLDAAHHAGIVHRDIKPANIFITTRGQAKILDFGLAKVATPLVGAPKAADRTSLPTEEHLTTPGVALGTAPYMSPEQARGEALDARTDLFSFGAVLYEMATGKPAFTGATTAMIHETILSRTPPPASTVNAQIPRAMDGIVGKALEKDRDLRYQHAADMRADLKRVQRDTDSGRAAAVPDPRLPLHSRLRAWRVGAVALMILAAAVFYQVWRPTRLFRASPPVQTRYRQITFVGDAMYPAISPDGKFVAYVTGKEGRGQKLMLQDLAGGQAVEISKALEIWNPEWSPDGTELAAFQLVSPQDGGIFLIPRLGGSRRLVANGWAACWSPGSQIAVASPPEAGFRIVDKVTGRTRSVHLSGFRWPHGLDWSPASNFIAVWSRLENGRESIWTVHPDGSQLRKVLEDNELYSPRWSPAGDAIYFLRTNQDGTDEILRIAVNPKTGQAKGPSAVILSGLEVGPVFTVSMDGRRVAYSTLLWYSNLWLARSRGPNIHSQPDTDFQTKALTTGARMLRFPSISPDGRWVAYASREHIYKMPIEGGTPIQLTFSDAEVASTPAWSPDGKRIAFGSDEGGAWKVWIVGADGADRRRFANTQLGGSRSEAVGDLKWSPGRLILYQRPGNRNFNTLDPETAEEKPLVQNESGSIFSPEYSPDGKNVALHWNRRPQGGLWIVSPAGHSETFLGDSGDLSPVGWSPDGSSIYAWDGAKNVMSIPVAPTRRGAPRPVFSVPGGLNIPFMTMSADGKEFVYCIQESRSDVWVVDNFDPANRK